MCSPHLRNADAVLAALREHVAEHPEAIEEMGWERSRYFQGLAWQPPPALPVQKEEGE